MVTVEVDPILTGRLPLPERYAFRTLGNPLAVIKGVCLAYVLRHPGRGVVLVDTGFHPDAVSHRRKDFGTAMNVMFASLKPEPFEPQLRERGIEPDAVETVLMTHPHVDHTSGMRLLPSSRFWISAAEWRAASAPRAAAKGFIGEHLPPDSRVELVDFTAGEPHGPFAATIDAFGDGSVRLVSKPGHTPGHMSVLVRTARGDVLLAGDAAYTRRNVRDQVLPLLTADAGAHRRTLAELKAFADANPHAPLVPSHDPEAYLEL